MSSDAQDPSELHDRHQPESIRLRTVTPVLTVDDIIKSLAWYRDIVGFHVAETHENDGGQLVAVSLVGGSQNLVLTQDDWAKGRERQKGEGFRVILGTSQSVDQIAATIKERGGVLESEPEDMPWGARAFALVDPDGFKLTITSL